MVESVIIIIGCYLFSALMVHAVYGSLPHMRGAAQHYVLVTKNSEQQAEIAVRAITCHSWLRGKTSRISVIDEGSSDLTVPILERLGAEGRVQLIRTRNWAETERMVRNFRRQVKVAGLQIGGGEDGPAEHQHKRSSGAGQSEAVTVIYMNRPEDRVKIPLFY